MRILVLGSGAREHAIILALRSEEAGARDLRRPRQRRDRRRTRRIVALDPNDPAAVTDFANENAIDLVVIGPEAPLVAGVADALRERGIPVFGPGKAAAQLEGSKAFAKRIMDAAGVPTGRALRATTRAEVEAALDELGAPYVVKADGLAAGKGVLVTDDRDAALAHADALPAARAACSSRSSSPAPRSRCSSSATATTCCRSAPRRTTSACATATPARTPAAWARTRRCRGSPTPFGGEEAFVDLVTRDVAEPVIRQLDAEGTPFIGLLYAGLILTDAGRQGHRVQRALRRPRDPGRAAAAASTRSRELLLAAASGTPRGSARARRSPTRSP